MKKLFVWMVVFAITQGAMAQNLEPITLQFEDPSKPGRIDVEIVNGSIEIIGHDGPDVVIHGTPENQDSDSQEVREDGLRVINAGGSGFSVELLNNRVEVSMPAPQAAVNFKIQVPRDTSLELNTVNGHIYVEGLRGEFEVSNVSGNISLKDVSGWAVASTVSGNIVANFMEVSADKSMGFSNLSGKIDLTLPADINADLRIEAGRGRILSNFDLALKPQVEHRNHQEENGRKIIEVNRATIGTLGTGGPLIELNSSMGNIYIRKGS